MYRFIFLVICQGHVDLPNGKTKKQHNEITKYRGPWFVQIVVNMVMNYMKSCNNNNNNIVNIIINNLFKVSKSNSTKLIKANYRKNVTTYKNSNYTI